MKKIFYIIIIFLTITNCKLKNIETNHGTALLEKKQKLLFINKTNKNDIINVLGPPSTTGLENNSIWIYIENKSTKSSILKFAKKKKLVGNILVVELDDLGILKNKKFYNLDDQNDLKFLNKTTITSEKDGFVYGVVSSLRQKIDSPKRNRNSNQQ